jgi:hypothetical protein
MASSVDVAHGKTGKRALPAHSLGSILAGRLADRKAHKPLHACFFEAERPGSAAAA